MKKQSSGLDHLGNVYVECIMAASPLLLVCNTEWSHFTVVA
jgi:hypothetical protein